MMKKGNNLPDEHHVMRYVSWTKLLKNEDDQVIGFLPQAFELRPEEETLSVNWIEYFNGSSHLDRIKASVKEFRKTRTSPVGKRSAYGVAKVEEIKETCSNSGYRVRVVYDPSKNKSHSAIRYLPRNDLVLLEKLATMSTLDMVHNSQV